MSEPAWMRYANEPDALWGLIYELRLEADQNPELAEWCEREAKDIIQYLEQRAAGVI